MSAPAAAEGERPPPRVRTPLGPYALVNPIFLSLKVALATALGLGLARLRGNPDTVTATFVAVLCTTPTMILGLRQGLAQLLGSLLGGVFGTAMMAVGAPLLLGIPAAVGLSTLASFLVRFPSGYPVAAFTALFVQAVPRGDPWMTLGVRMEAVGIAALSGFVANLAISFFQYRVIFTRRLRLVEEHCDALLARAAEEGPLSVAPGFSLLSLLEDELAGAAEELRWRGNRETLEWIVRIERRVEAIHHLLHLVYDLGLLRRDHDLEPESLRPFMTWVRCGEGDAPPVPEPLERTAARIAELWEELREGEAAPVPWPVSRRPSP